MRLLLLFFTFLVTSEQEEAVHIQINGLAQGTTYHVVYYAKDSLVKNTK